MSTWHYSRVQGRDVDLDGQVLVSRTCGLPSPVAGGDKPSLKRVIGRIVDLGNDAVVGDLGIVAVVVVAEDTVELNL